MNETTQSEHNKKSLILKFEYDGQQYELASLTTNDTIGDLRAVVCSMLNIDDFKRINLKTLQPTKVIDTSDDTKPLAEIFRQTRERIVVEEIYVPNSGSAHDEVPEDFQQSTSDASLKTNIKHHKPDTSEGAQAHGSSNSIRPDGTEYSAYDTLSSNLNDQSNHLTSANSNESPMRQRKLPRDQSEFPVCSSTGYLLKHPVPSNNSCLFISVHFCLTHGIVDDQIGRSMRRIIADTVASDKQHFDDAFLGKSNADYCNWILDDNNWGGAIELSILCKFYKTEIVAIDVQNIILNRFGEDSHYPQRMLLLYDGLHYDPLKFQPLDDNQSIQTLFSTENIEVLTLAEELAREAKQSHQFTDMNTITMKCATCNAELDTKTAQEHAAETGHVDFVEK